VRRAAPLLTAGAALALLVGCASTSDLSGSGDGPLGAEDSPADLYVAMAQEYFRLGQMDAALQRAEHGVKVDGRNAKARYMLAFLYQRLGETARAETQFREAVALDPKNPDIRNALGTFYCGQRRFDEADAEFRRALDNPLYATPEVALLNAAVCARQAGDATKAADDLSRAVAANPRFGPAIYEQARLRYDQGDFKAAKGHLDRYFEVAPVAPQALLLAVRVERRLGNRKRAETYAQTLRRQFPDSSEVLQLTQS
jgi:type IV pilus assembly protein PilF